MRGTGRRRWTTAFAGLVASGLAAWALVPTPARGQAPPAGAADARGELAERVRRLEEMNQALLERDADRERRYRELEDRYRNVLERLDRVESAGAAAGRPVPPEPSLPGPSTEAGAEPGLPAGGRTGESAVASPDPREDIPGPGRDFPDFEPGREIPLRGRLGEGFELVSSDDEFSLRFRALNQVDFKVFAPNDQSPTTSGIYIPRMRFYFEGDLTRLFEYELSIQRSVEGQFDLLDAYLNARLSEAFQIKFGRAIVPYSYDWYDHLEPYFITPERGLFPLNYGLSRQGGLMAWGVLGGGRAEYAVGGFDGRLLGLADNNTTRDAVGYLNWRPFLRSERRPALRFLNLGGSFAGGQTVRFSEQLPLRTSIQSSENDEAARSASITFFQFDDDVRGFGDRLQGALHLSYYVGGLSIEAEAQAGRFGASRVEADASGRVLRAMAPVYYPVGAYHVAAGYFLTGERVEGRTTVVPLRPFDPWHHRWGPGAVEVFGRVSQLGLGSQVFTSGLADPADWTRHATVTDAGFNWYLNRFLKVYVDWQHSFFGSPVLVNERTGLHRRTSDLLWLRLQIWF